MKANTISSYRSDLRQFAVSLDDRPFSDSALAAYLSYLFHQSGSPAVGRLAIASIRRQAKYRGFSDTFGSLSAEVMRGFAYSATNWSRAQVPSISWKRTDALWLNLEHAGRVIDLWNAAAVAIMSNALLRISEVAGLHVDDVEIRDDDSGLLTVRCSKTDQEGEGAILYLGLATLARLERWLQAAGIDRRPLFRLMRRGQVVTDDPLWVQSMREIVKRAAERLDIDKAADHSLRIGAAQSLAERSVSLVEMQVARRWTSPAIQARYSWNTAASRSALARLRRSR